MTIDCAYRRFIKYYKCNMNVCSNIAMPIDVAHSLYTKYLAFYIYIIILLVVFFPHSFVRLRQLIDCLIENLFIFIGWAFGSKVFQTERRGETRLASLEHVWESLHEHWCMTLNYWLEIFVVILLFIDEASSIKSIKKTRQQPFCEQTHTHTHP